MGADADRHACVPYLPLFLSQYVTRLHDRIVHVLEELTGEAGAIEGRNLRLEVRGVRFVASRDRHGDVVCFCGSALALGCGCYGY
jgi:hypothetical protein